MKKKYTLSVFSENKVGLLGRATAVFTRRKINIESITVSDSEVKGIARYTIVVNTTFEQAEQLARQLEKIVEVFRAFVHDDEQVVYQEIALYKVSLQTLSAARMVEQLIRDNHARILSVEPEFIVIEKTGHEYETQALFEQLQPYGVLEFVRSGRVAITKPMKELSTYLKEMEEQYRHSFNQK